MRIMTSMPSTVQLSSLLESGEHLVTDGALATELEARGCNLDDPLWSAKVLVENPHLIRDVHRDYFSAGARIAIDRDVESRVLERVVDRLRGFADRRRGRDRPVA